MIERKEDLTMSNTTSLYRAVAAYMLARSEAREEWQLMGRRYASAKGSQMYVDEMKKAREKRDKTVADAQFIARQEVRETLKAMAEKADKIKMQPPTEEQLRILQLLSMKEKLTEAELAGAANAMDGNAAALSLVDELARKSGIITTPFTSRLSVKAYDPLTARQTIQRLGDACYRIIDNTSGASRARLLAAENHQKMYGGTFDPYEFPEEKGFEDETDFYNQMNIPLSAFSSAVD